MKDRKLIIGFGNPLRGDDGVGWEVASRLAAVIPDEAAHITTVLQLTPELAEPISEADLVVFIDADQSGDPGTWRCEEVKPRPLSGNSLGHHFDVFDLLACSRTIFDASPRAFVVSLSAESFEFQDKLTPRVGALLPDVVNHLLLLIANTAKPACS
ncbi:MAG: hydrogenase maturation protease [Terrimicrobiaceae bacterium]